MLKQSKLRAIDFARSSCTWLLNEQPSHGRFSLDAALTIGEQGSAGPERFVLSAQVLACEVYGAAMLFRSPSYGFSAAFSHESYRIFRDPYADQLCDDTIGPIEERFLELKTDIVHADCSQVEPRDALGHARLSARIVLAADRGVERVELEFPVRHINIDREAGRFQVETGPLLFSQAGEGAAVGRLCRAYVAFNRMDRAEFLLDAPRGRARRKAWSRAVQRACEISLLQVDA